MNRPALLLISEEALQWRETMSEIEETLGVDLNLVTTPSDTQLSNRCLPLRAHVAGHSHAYQACFNR